MTLHAASQTNRQLATNMEVFEATNETNTLKNAAIKARGAKSEAQLETAKKHFDEFLRKHGGESVDQYTTDSIPHHLVSAELLGCFGTFLFMKLKKLSSGHAYISQIKSFFDERFRDTYAWALHYRNSAETWYSDIRSGMKDMYTNRAIEEGESLVDQAPPMYRESLRSVASILFADDSAVAYMERDLLVTQ